MIISRTVTRKESSSAEVFNGKTQMRSLLLQSPLGPRNIQWLVCSFAVTRTSLLLYECVKTLQTQEFPTLFPLHPYPSSLRWLIYIAKASSPFSRCFTDTYLSFVPTQRPSLTVSLRDESGPQGRKFRCCLRSLWLSSGETRQPS